MIQRKILNITFTKWGTVVKFNSQWGKESPVVNLISQQGSTWTYCPELRGVWTTLSFLNTGVLLCFQFFSWTNFSAGVETCKVTTDCCGQSTDQPWNRSNKRHWPGKWTKEHWTRQGPRWWGRCRKWCWGRWGIDHMGRLWSSHHHTISSGAVGRAVTTRCTERSWTFFFSGVAAQSTF